MQKPPLGTKCGKMTRLRFKIQGQPFSMYVHQWSPENKILADSIGLTIFRDYTLGQFDQTLEKYESMKQPQTILGYSKDDLIAKLETEIKQVSTIPKRNVLAHLRKYPKPIGSPKQATDFYNWMAQNLKVNSAATYLVVLKLISRDLFGHIKAPTLEAAEPIALTKDQLEQILAALETCRYKPLFIFLLNTGLRVNEALAITWSKVNIEQRYCLIDASLDNQRQRGKVKTRRARRIGLSTAAILALELVKPTEVNPDDYVFTNTRGQPILLGTLRKVLYKHLDQAGLPKTIIKSFRSTFASYLIASKECSLIEVSKQLGNTVPVLVKHYATIINQVEIPNLFD